MSTLSDIPKELFVELMELASQCRANNWYAAKRIISICDKYTNIGNWCAYWFYDLDQGKNYVTGKVVSESGKEICLRTAEDLYNFIYSDIGGAWQIGVDLEALNGRDEY